MSFIENKVIAKSSQKFYLGLGCIVVGICLLYFFCQTEIFSCSRSQNLCKMEEKKLFSSEVTTLMTVPLNSINYAEVVEVTDETDSDIAMYSLGLDTKKGKIIGLERGSSEKSDFIIKAKVMNKYFHSNDEKIKITEEGMSTILMSLCLVFFGAWLSFSPVLPSSGDFLNSSHTE